MTIEESSYLLTELKKIEKWEKSQKGLWFWEKIGRIPFKLLDRLTPAFIQDKMALALDEIGNYLQFGGKYMSKEKNVLKKFQKKLPNLEIITLEDVKTAPLEIMNEVSKDMQKSLIRAAAVQGATTGVGGIFTLAADIPLLLGISIKTIQDIALSYGFNPEEKRERVFVIKCLQFSNADTVGKTAILNELSNFDSEDKRQEMISQLQGWREVIYTYRDQFGLKKLLQMVPIAGILFGAFSNRSMIADLAETADMLYKKRRIVDRLNQTDTFPSEIS
ncbi:EcsC family protein [Bacillus massiliglaciei]|uniref:EcsC family protein n=1 Tax=Bacillus massiliglaciei TaxID=1816693 RepID=UPI000B06E719|nr:EcsC family protein [Bacillus massiliglaciei]